MVTLKEINEIIADKEKRIDFISKAAAPDSRIMLKELSKLYRLKTIKEKIKKGE